MMKEAEESSKNRGNSRNKNIARRKTMKYRKCKYYRKHQSEVIPILLQIGCPLLITNSNCERTIHDSKLRYLYVLKMCLQSMF